MPKTLHFVVRVKVPDHMTVRNIRNEIIDALDRFPINKYATPRVIRPHGRLGVALRDMDVGGKAS